ncbi:MAG: response regulator [Steroidobacteraceae bacterium]|nr:response regulator [Steroidobacteraceae bacterium]
MKILVIDDEPFVLKLLVRQLENLGYAEVIPHERAQDALALLEIEAESVGLIFCDLQMPEMDGVEFVRQLVRVGYAGGLVLVSGEDERILQAAQNLAQAHKLDVLGALQKPVSSEQLQLVLESNLLRSAAAPRAARKTYEPEALRRAIANGELVNYYQPKVAFASGAVAGVETLVRWKHPRDGLVFPDQFIAVAEEHGLIDDLTRAVLTAALKQARLWQDMGITLPVAVNVSMDNLMSVDFPDLVTREMREAGVPASLLVLEVTESRLMKNPLVALDILTRLRLKRIGLSIDDFGTGHSSLAQLRDLPFEELKVDRGFVHGACRDASRTVILQASLGMARQLRMKSVAEGVEDRDDWDCLRAAGCDLAQGYFIAKPMPAAALPTWLSAWRARRKELFASAP